MPNVPVLSKNSVTSVNCDLTEYPQRLPPRLQKGQTVIIPDTHGNYLLFARHLLESGAATLGMCDYERLARLYYKKGKHTQDELKERQQIINQLKFVEGINVLLIGDYDGDRAEDDGPNYGIINKMRQSKVNVQMCLSNHGIVALALWVGLIEDKVKYKLAYRKIASMRELKKLNYIEYAQQNETPVLFYVENEKTYHLYSKAEKMLSGSGGYAKDIGWGLRDVTNINTVFNELQFTDNLQLTENAPEKVRLALAGCRLHNLYYPVINVRPDQHNSLTGLVDSVIRGDVELDEVKNFVKTHLLPNLIILDYFVDFNASKPQLWTVAHAPVNWARIHKLAEWLNVPYRDAGLLNQCVTLRKIKRAWKDKIDKGDYSFLQKLNDEMQSIIKRGGRIEYPPNDSVLTAFVWSRDPSCGQGQIYGHVGPDDSKYPYGISLDRGELGKYEDIKKGTLYSLTCTKTELNDKFEKLLDNYENLLDKLKEIDENRGDSEAKKIIAKQSRFFISQIEENFEESKLETYEDFFDSILTFLDNKGIDSIYCLPFLVASNSMTMEDYVSFLKDIQHEDLDSKVQNGKEISEEFKTKYSSLGEDIAAFNDCIVKLKYKNYFDINTLYDYKKNKLNNEVKDAATRVALHKSLEKILYFIELNETRNIVKDLENSNSDIARKASEVCDEISRVCLEQGDKFSYYLGMRALKSVGDVCRDIKKSNNVSQEKISTCIQISRRVQGASKPYKVLGGVMLGFASAVLFGIGVGATLLSVGLLGSLVGSPGLAITVPVTAVSFGLSASLAWESQKLIKENYTGEQTSQKMGSFMKEVYAYNANKQRSSTNVNRSSGNSSSMWSLRRISKVQMDPVPGPVVVEDPSKNNGK